MAIEHEPTKVALLSTSFHREHMQRMIEAATEEATSHGMVFAEHVSIPGSMEVPLALHRALRGPVEGAVVLGIIERGETAHGLVMGQAVIQSILTLQIQHDKPVGVGILGPEIFPSQIAPRVDKYARAAVAALAVQLSGTPS
ncbi:MAG: 6,7-dimethyl-8-ribityllumazine synthase [Bacteroidota bacterium]